MADLATERLLPQIAELELVEDPADLDAERSFLILAVEAIGDGHDAHALEVKLRDDREHEIVVASQARKIVD